MKLVLEKSVHQKFDLLTKLLGVFLVANGVNKFRYSEVGSALFFISLGIMISVLPLYVEVRE
jgi:hypothetical protein